ncbi:UNVERIFIED_CONTAM: hypothetical protein BEN50_02805 [Euhalothece sp. KZN 001]
MSNNFGNTLVKLGLTAAVGYGAYRGSKYLVRKANEHAEAQQRQQKWEAQQLAAQQQAEYNRLVQHFQDQYNLGIEKLKQEDFGGALYVFKKLLDDLGTLGQPTGDLAKLYADIHQLIAKAQLNLEDNQGAIRSLDQSLALNSDNAESYALRAIAKFQNNDQGGAKADIAIAVSLAPDKTSYQTLKTEMSQVGSNRVAKEDIVRLHEATVAAVASEFQKEGINLANALSDILESQMLLPIVLATQFYVLSDLEMQLLSVLPSLAQKLPPTYLAYWEFKQEHQSLAVYEEIQERFVSQSSNINQSGLIQAVKALHEKEAKILALPGFKSQLTNLDWIEQHAYKQALTVASFVEAGENQLETMVTPVVNFSQSLTQAFLP